MTAKTGKYAEMAAVNRAKVKAAFVKLGAGTINAAARESGMCPESARRHIVKLIESGEVEELIPAAPHVGAVFCLVESDDVGPAVTQRTVKDWARGQFGRDSMIAAFFGAAGTRSEVVQCG